ncbi:galectin-9-like [Mercenaria mercenaria]|uniref:galectin-9-like n=1 Tax=Mercenaria mercenaria TaxID=6596 RepID=UPI00234F036B|nr:galectin-9-like [Mercenaria mercenaria]
MDHEAKNRNITADDNGQFSGEMNSGSTNALHHHHHHESSMDHEGNKRKTADTSGQFHGGMNGASHNAHHQHQHHHHSCSMDHEGKNKTTANDNGHFGGEMDDASTSAPHHLSHHHHQHYPLPFVQKTGFLRPNDMHFICGVPHPNARRVTVNLQCGNDVIAFHFDVRFNYLSGRNVIVRNTNIKKGWGPPEIYLPGGYFPFQPNKYFEMIILAEPHCFKVAVNNQHLLEFKHRIPLDRVDTLYIKGDVMLTQVKFKNCSMDHGANNGIITSDNGHALHDAHQPHHHHCPGCQCHKADDRKVSTHNSFQPPPYVLKTGFLRPNNIHFICGVPHQNARRVTINLQCGNDIVAFHFDVRFNCIGCRNAIIRTTKDSKGWGPEERGLPYFPFQPNMNFEMIILTELHCFKVAVNNQHLLEFKHRIPLDRVDTLHITGDVTLTQVRFQECMDHEANNGITTSDNGQALHDAHQPYHHHCPGCTCHKADDRKVSTHNSFQPIPFVRKTGFLRPNNIHFICGVPHPNAKRVTFDLQCGNDIVAFHFDVRFNYLGCRNVIVRNTKDRKGWGPEERRLPYFPFQPNMSFEMIILTEHRCFKVAVNNQHLLEFKHRIPLDRVDTLYITGDVTLTQVRFQE